MKNPVKKRLILASLASAASLYAPLAFGADATWSGALNGNWNNSGNWTAAFPNANGDDATFNNAVNTTISLNQAIQVSTLTFDTSSVGSFTFNAGGGTLSVGVNSGSSAISMNAGVGAVTQTINPQIRMVGTTNITINNNSTGGGFDFLGGFDNTLAAARTLTFTGSSAGVGTIGNITQSGGGALSTTFNSLFLGTYNLTGSNNYAGTLGVAGGTVRLSGSNSGVSATSLTTGGILQINTSDSRGGMGTGGLTQNASTIEAFAADRVISISHSLIGASTFSGSYSLTQSGVVQMSGANSTTTNNIASGELLTFNGTDIFLTGDNTTARIRTFTGPGDWLVSANIANNNFGNTVASGLTKSGSGMMTLSGSNTYTGVTSVTGGVLRLNSANALGSGLLALNGGVVGLGNGDFTRSIGSTAGTVQIANSGGIGGFAAYGADRLVNLGGAGVSLAWTNSNFMSGSGTLAFSDSTATHKVTFQNGINLVSAARTVQVNNGAAAVDATMSGAITSTISGSGSLIKTGLGTLELTGTNTYSGLTTASAGTLLINGSQAGGMSVSSGAALGGTGTIAGAATIAGSLRPGNSIGTLTVQNDVTWDAGNAWVFELGTSASTLALANSGSSTQDQLNITGVGSDFLSGTGTVFTFDFAGTGAEGWYKVVDYSGTTDFVAGDFVATNLASGLSGVFVVDASTSAVYLNVVPEPGTVGLLTVGLMATLFVRRRRVS